MAYLCAHISTSIMIDVPEDEVALETQKYKVPHNSLWSILVFVSNLFLLDLPVHNKPLDTLPNPLFTLTLFISHF